MYVTRRLACLLICGLVLSCTPMRAADAPLPGVKRVVFLGDSITYAGHYIEFLEATLRLKYPGWTCEFLDLGLPSETASGLSEPGHAGGSFPRPDLHERLERVLDQTKPDLVVACYGMNDGIYYPFGEDRFAKYRQGLEFLREQASKRGAKVLHLTPPVFDPQPIKARTLPAGRAEYRQPYEGYDDTLARYSAWLVSKRADGWDVIDIHTPMKKYLLAKRESNPAFVLAGDGVHLNYEGHWIITREILTHWGENIPGVGPKWVADQPNGPALLRLVESRVRILKDAWLTQTKHLRPGMGQGVPLPEAEKRAEALNQQIKQLQAKS